MKNYNFEVTLVFSETIEAKNEQEARELIQEHFDLDYGLVPQGDEIKIISESEVI